MSDSKATNPKEAFASKKLPLEVVPDSAVAALAVAFTEGALKYGRYNWRVAGVRASTYRSALGRHIAAWWNGEDVDPDTKVPHLANAMACIAIIFDAELCEKLNDDRPPKAPVGDQMRKLAETVAHLKEILKDYSPPQYNEREHGFRAAPPLPNDPHPFFPPAVVTSTQHPPAPVAAVSCKCGRFNLTAIGEGAPYLSYDGNFHQSGKCGRVPKSFDEASEAR